MKLTKIESQIQRALNTIQKQHPIVRHVCQEIMSHGGRVLLVGGAVRDMLLGLPIKDIDIEVHGMPFDQLEALLKRFGTVSLIGKSFGVLRYPGLDIDWAVPRTDTAGRKPEVKLDPYMAIEDAFARRDLTINAMGVDMQTGQLIDPFGGKADLEHGVLRAPNATFFQEDPLRLFRVMQFASRFHMVPDEELDAICSKMDIASVSRERIEKEFEKMLLKSKRPSLGIRWLKKMGRLGEILPELAATVGVKQGDNYHPEGDVFEHTMQTVDAAAQMPVGDQEQRLILLYAALCHDLGKVEKTEIAHDGSVTSYGHAEHGARVAKKLLRRITNNKDLIAAVATLVTYHMEPIQFINNDAKPAAYKRLANKLAPYASLALLADLVVADKRGRNPKGQEPLRGSYTDIETFKKRAQKARVFEMVEQPVLRGSDIADLVAPGPKMGALLKLAYQLQLDEEITDKEALKKRLIEQIQRKG